MPRTWNASHIQFLTQPESRALLRVITRKRDRALFLVAYRHRLRASEAGLLRVDDLTLEQQRLISHRVKRSLPGIHPLRADEVTALKAYLRPFFFSKAALEEVLRQHESWRPGLDAAVTEEAR